MDRVIRLEKSKDSQELDLQFTASFEYGPFLHEEERHNWAEGLSWGGYFYNNMENLAINQASCLRHVTEQGISQTHRVIPLLTGSMESQDLLIFPAYEGQAPVLSSV